MNSGKAFILSKKRFFSLHLYNVLDMVNDDGG